MSGIKKNMGDIQRAVQILAGTYDKDFINFEIAKIISVDTKNWLCDAQLVSSKAQNTLSGIQLSAEKASNGFIQVPKLKSNVILAITWRNEVYVFMCSEIDALVFHQVNADNKTYEEFVINCNNGFNGSLPLGIRLIDGGGNGVVITSGSGQTTNSNGNNGLVMSSGSGSVTNGGNGIVITNSDNPPANSSNNIQISCKGLMQMNSGIYGGLTKTQLLQSELLNNNSYITALFAACSGLAATLNALAPGASAAFNGAMAGVSLGDYTQIENTDVTHGPSV